MRPAVRCPTLKYNTKLREGKGFSLEELKAAGVGAKEARSVGIPVDHRRKNRSEEGLKLNAERVKAYRARLIVVPRHSKKNKGKKPDLKNVETTRDTAAAFPIPAPVAEKPRAITAEEKEVEAFRTLRDSRAAHRQAGAVAARLKKKEEAEAAAKK